MRSITMSRRRAVLVTVAAGALVAATSATATATTEPPGTDAPGTEAGSTDDTTAVGPVGGSVAPNPDIEEGLTIYFIPKDTQNPYEVIADGAAPRRSRSSAAPRSSARAPWPRLKHRSRRSKRPSPTRPTPS